MSVTHGQTDIQRLSILRIKLTFSRDFKKQTKMYLKQPVEAKV